VKPDRRIRLRVVASAAGVLALVPAGSAAQSSGSTRDPAPARTAAAMPSTATHATRPAARASVRAVNSRISRTVLTWDHAHPDAPVSSGIPAGQRTVVVAVSARAARSPAWQSAIAAAVGAQGQQVRFTDDVQTATPLDCPSRLACDPPLRGDLWMSAGDQPDVDIYCTTGVIVKSKATLRPYVLTAGHCMHDYAGLWYAHTPRDGKIHAIGRRKTWTYGRGGDFGFLSIDNLREWRASPYLYVGACSTHCPGHHVRLDAAYRVVGTGTAKTLPSTGSPREKRLCKAGATSGTSCGVLVETGVTLNYTNGPTVGGLGVIKGMYDCQGDSGSPVFMNGKVYGILVAGSDNTGTRVGPNGGTQKCGYTAFFVGIHAAIASAHMYVPTVHSVRP
jgi:hypothetical protein